MRSCFQDVTPPDTFGRRATKAQFILKARGVASGALATPRDAIQRVEDASASLARSVYTRGSVSTHVATKREEVLTMKPYVDGVLAELLQVHQSA